MDDVVAIITIDQEWSEMEWVERIRNSCHLSIKKGNENQHLLFWSIKTLIGFKVRIKGLIA